MRLRKLTWYERLFEWLGWHKPMNQGTFNLASFSGLETRCIRCGSRLLMDSQGNWFAVSCL